MSPKSPLLPIVLGLVLAACADRGGVRKPGESASLAADSPAFATDSQLVAADTGGTASGCVRGAAEPIFAASEFTRTSLFTGIERVRAGDSIGLTVRHYGCAHYGLDLEFVWSEGAMPGWAAALEQGARLLESIPAAEANRSLVRSLAGGIRFLAADSAAGSRALSELETLSVSVPAANTLLVRYDVAL